MSVVWNNVKFYVLAFAIVLAGALVSTGLQLLENLFPEIHPLSKLAANLSGMTLGGVMMLLAFLRDNRLDEERNGAPKTHSSRRKPPKSKPKPPRKRPKLAQKEAKSAQEQAQTAQQEAELQRQRAEAERHPRRPRRSRIAARDFPIPGRRPDRARSPA